MITMDSFGSMLPENWEEIADFLNALIELDPSPELTGRMGLFLLISFLAELLLLLIIFALCGKRRTEFRYRMLALATVSGRALFFCENTGEGREQKCRNLSPV